MRHERLSAREDACRLMYVSDIHLRPGRSEGLCRRVVEAASSSAVDAILLGGDLIDRRSELARLSGLIRELRALAPVFAVGGNHDVFLGLDRVRDAVTEGGGEWIHAGTACVRHGSRVIAICGPDARGLSEGDFRILCAHNPRVWKAARGKGFDLVLAGHLHGCQVVAFERWDRLFPGAAFYPYCYLNHRHGSTRLVVSRGVSDLIPVRWRCPREVVVCSV